MLSRLHDIPPILEVTVSDAKNSNDFEIVGDVMPDFTRAAGRGAAAAADERTSRLNHARLARSLAPSPSPSPSVRTEIG